jgi:hypothetical protein
MRVLSISLLLSMAFVAGCTETPAPPVTPPAVTTTPPATTEVPLETPADPVANEAKPGDVPAVAETSESKPAPVEEPTSVAAPAGSSTGPEKKE